MQPGRQTFTGLPIFHLVLAGLMQLGFGLGVSGGNRTGVDETGG